MAKHGKTCHMEVYRKIFHRRYNNMPDAAKVLYFYLNELEQRYCTSEKTWFFRSDEDIANDLDWSVSKAKRAKQQLKKYHELIRFGTAHWQDPETGKRSEKRVTTYKILNPETGLFEEDQYSEW